MIALWRIRLRRRTQRAFSRYRIEGEGYGVDELHIFNLLAQRL
ncbi:hypothetical protein [Candidatus Endolissoclinum faulkneri]|nr:hypothetical protein [Candidatus Endolissoclinum faulkneri]